MIERSLFGNIRNFVLFWASILFLIPFYVLVRNALMNDSEITSFNWIWFPIPPKFENLFELFNDVSAPTGIGLKNSATIAVTQVIFQMLFASMAGYGLARVPNRGKRLMLYLVMATMMVPFAVIVVPLYVVIASFGWVNTLQGIIVPGLFSAFSAFMFRQFYLDFPSELEEAGKVDGIGYLGIYWYLALPNSKSVLIALGALAFVNDWNAFLWPLVVGQDRSSWTIQVVQSTFLTAQTINLHELFMGAVVAILPILLIFVVLQQYLVEGVARTGIKG
jgi:multiple sugar transport system permease protein